MIDAALPLTTDHFHAARQRRLRAAQKLAAEAARAATEDEGGGRSDNDDEAAAHVDFDARYDGVDANFATATAAMREELSAVVVTAAQRSNGAAVQRAALAAATPQRFPHELRVAIERVLPIVDTVDDIAALPARLDAQFAAAAAAAASSGDGKQREPKEAVVFSGGFVPSVVDATCLLGMAPLSLRLAPWLLVFSPRCQTAAAITYVSPDACRAVVTPDTVAVHFFAPGTADAAISSPASEVGKLRVPLRLVRRLRVFVNHGGEELFEAFAMIRQQHGEQWLCAPLRKCFAHMLTAPPSAAAFRTRVVLVTLRDVGAPGQPLVAAELGFFTGSMLTSATGAFCVSGAGNAQLAAVALMLRAAGAATWSLGTVMAYKSRALRAQSVAREAWHPLVARHVAEGNAVAEAFVKFDGASLAGLFGLPPAAGGDLASPASASDSSSKAARKRDAKRAFLAARKAAAVSAKLAAAVPAADA